MTIVDTSILVRIANPADPAHQAIAARVAELPDPVAPPQAFYELWTVLTRPQVVNGLGFTGTEADGALRICLALLRTLPDPPGLFDRWRALCVEYDVKGKPSHDARIAAFTVETRATDLLTLNPADFKRFPVNLA